MPRVMRIGALMLWVVFAFGCSRRSGSATREAGAPSASAASAGARVLPKPDVSLFYSADLRGNTGPKGEGGGLSNRASIVDRARTTAPLVVQLDAGDFSPGPGDAADLDTQEKRERRAKLIFAAYQRMAVDVVTLGERDLAIAPAVLEKAWHGSDVAVVLTNATREGAEKLPFLTEKLIDEGGRSIGVFAILDPVGFDVPPAQRWGISLTDPVAASLQAINALRSRGARLVVGLLHTLGGLTRAKEILAHAPDIDVLVLGHEGQGFIKPELVGRTRIVYAGRTSARLDLRYPAGGGAPVFDDANLSFAGVPPQVGVEVLVQIDRAPTEPDTVDAKGKMIFENWTYGSNGACELCHKKEVEQWKTTEHAHALATLVKSKHDKDRDCLGCHTTGYLLPGGTQRITTALEQFGDVGCECCHGPSADHVRAINKTKGTSRKVDPALCLGCHTVDRNGLAFDAPGAMRSILGPGHEMKQ